MDERARFAKRVADAGVLRDVPASRSVEMAFELIRFTRDIHEAARRATP